MKAILKHVISNCLIVAFLNVDRRFREKTSKFMRKRRVRSESWGVPETVSSWSFSLRLTLMIAFRLSSNVWKVRMMLLSSGCNFGNGSLFELAFSYVYAYGFYIYMYKASPTWLLETCLWSAKKKSMWNTGQKNKKIVFVIMGSWYLQETPC